MKKILFFAMGLFSMTTFAQSNSDLYGRVGINTVEPKASLDITRHTGVPAQNPQGLLLPHLTTAQRNEFTQSKIPQGLMIYNTTKNCVDYYNGTQWSCTDGTKIDEAISPSSEFMSAPWMKFSNGVLNATGNDFVEYNGNGELPATTQIKWFTKSEILNFSPISINGITYKIPNIVEQGSVLPAFYSWLRFDHLGSLNERTLYDHEEIPEAYKQISITNTKVISDYKANKTNKTFYAIRYKNIAEVKSAWRYQLITGKGLRVQIISLRGTSTNLTIDEIGNDNWWNNKVIDKEIFIPKYGVSSSIDRGIYGCFWGEIIPTDTVIFGWRVIDDARIDTESLGHLLSTDTDTLPIFLIKQ